MFSNNFMSGWEVGTGLQGAGNQLRSQERLQTPEDRVLRETHTDLGPGVTRPREARDPPAQVAPKGGSPQIRKIPSPLGPPLEKRPRVGGKTLTRTRPPRVERCHRDRRALDATPTQPRTLGLFWAAPAAPGRDSIPFPHPARLPKPCGGSGQELRAAPVAYLLRRLRGANEASRKDPGSQGRCASLRPGRSRARKRGRGAGLEWPGDQATSRQGQAPGSLETRQSHPATVPLPWVGIPLLCSLQ